MVSIFRGEPGTWILHRKRIGELLFRANVLEAIDNESPEYTKLPPPKAPKPPIIREDFSNVAEKKEYDKACNAYEKELDMYLEKMDAYNKRVRAWNFIESTAFGIIADNISTNVRTACGNAFATGEVNKIWKELEIIYGKESKQEVTDIYKLLATKNVDNFNNVTEYIDHLEACFSNLELRDLAESPEKKLSWLNIGLEESNKFPAIKNVLFHGRLLGKSYDEMKTLIIVESSRGGAERVSSQGKTQFTQEVAMKTFAKETRRCHKCKQVGHIAINCNVKGKFDKFAITCAFCRKKGHSAQECRNLKAQRQETTITIEKEQVKAILSTNHTENCVFGLDTCATRHVVKPDVELVNVYIGKDVEISGYDGKSIIANKYGEIPHIGEALITGKSNLLSFHQLIKDGASIQYQEEKDAFKVTMNNIILTFVPNLAGNAKIYATVIGNTEVANKVEDKVASKELHLKLAHASSAALLKMLKNGNIINTDLTDKTFAANNVEIENCDGCIKGKGMRTKVTQNISNDNNNVILYVDIFFWAKRMYIISVEKATGHIVTVFLQNKNEDNIARALTGIINIYKCYNIVVKQIRSDAESCFLVIQSQLEAIGVLLSTSTPGEHNARAERYIRTIKDKTRSVITGLSFKLPTKLYGYALEYAVQCINMTCNSLTLDKTPNEIIVGSKTDLEKEARSYFGQLGEFKVPYPKSKEEQKTETGIVIGRVYNSHGILKVFLPYSNKIVKRFHFVPKNYTSELISFLEESSSYDKEILNELQEGHDEEIIDESNEKVDEENDEPNYWQEPVEDFIGLTVAEAYDQDEEKAKIAIKAEIQQMIDEQVWEPIHFNEIPNNCRKQIIPSQMLLKNKYLPSGELDKMKARLAAGGHKEIQQAGSDNRSPTVDISIFFLLNAIAANKKYYKAAIDIKGAYLKVAIAETQYMKLSVIIC